MRRIPPLALAGAAAALQHVASRRSAPSLTSAVLAVPVLLTSAWFLAGSVQEFRQRRTTVSPIAVESVSTMVTTGPNALTRNPMYVGMVGLLVGQAIIRRSVGAALPAAAFAVIIDRWQIPAEERALEARFGPEFARYRSAVPRWLGPVRPAT